MKKTLALTSLTLAALALPLVSFAATTIGNVFDAGSFIIGIINNLVVPILFAVAFIVFVYGAFETFIVGATSDEVKTKGKNLMLWGLIGFFVMASVWGLVNVLTGTIGFSSTSITRPGASGLTNLPNGAECTELSQCNSGVCYGLGGGHLTGVCKANW
ncbi:hypothetical protein A2609_02380 [Candidatus Kaiserbacteria bacterium RIFOXYD1_FULL_47_14]|uniref:Ammonium transporter AmtB-like domain-containing protein n=1 Tax=Candidatus Kaiserbacteria bacterium RIFOXYD1_FULL_47_14 TaxID=1798533 RepID=A0A1F6G791_9BACT|nr:MAG: hypothetical protein A2609_02380 [Candidatus Kaiserbacteria bacterium RIFOXYD1_FULL_47_14]